MPNKYFPGKSPTVTALSRPLSTSGIPTPENEAPSEPIPGATTPLSKSLFLLGNKVGSSFFTYRRAETGSLINMEGQGEEGKDSCAM